MTKEANVSDMQRPVRRGVRRYSSLSHSLSVETRQSWKKEQVTHRAVLEHFPARPDNIAKLKGLVQPSLGTR